MKCISMTKVPEVSKVVQKISRGKNMNLLRSVCGMPTDWAILPNYLWLSQSPEDGVGGYLHPKHECEFYYNNVKYDSVEDAMVKMTSAMASAGSQLRYDREKYALIREVIRAKLIKCKEARLELMSTKSRIIVYAGKNPEFGIGLDYGDGRMRNPGEWKGQNLYGLALMELRAEGFRFPTLKRRYTEMDGTEPCNSDVIKRANQEYKEKYLI